MSRFFYSQQPNGASFQRIGRDWDEFDFGNVSYNGDLRGLSHVCFELSGIAQADDHQLDFEGRLICTCTSSQHTPERTGRTACQVAGVEDFSDVSTRDRGGTVRADVDSMAIGRLQASEETVHAISDVMVGAWGDVALSVVGCEDTFTSCIKVNMK
ncbi:hypothetical protein BaRGS_00027247 [Batillaria attramentaria]|uniref:Uncharacterized protein n=1 Tax=Batillaria attramentaria TaxID=370345 RepID=A0ABD0K3B4_9CAEN